MLEVSLDSLKRKVADHPLAVPMIRIAGPIWLRDAGLGPSYASAAVHPSRVGARTLVPR